LPVEGMKELQQAFNWSGTDVSSQVNNGVRKMALEVLDDSGRREYALGSIGIKIIRFTRPGGFSRC
jgi:hypothetical protein